MAEESLEDRLAQKARELLSQSAAGNTFAGLANNPNLVLANSGAKAVLIDVVEATITEFADFSPKGWTHDGKEVLYTSGGNVYARDFAGNDRTLLQNIGDCLKLAEAPDGSGILYIDIDNNLFLVYYEQPDLPFKVDEEVTSVCWSPDCGKFAYEKKEMKGLRSVVVRRRTIYEILAKRYGSSQGWCMIPLGTFGLESFFYVKKNELVTIRFKSEKLIQEVSIAGGGSGSLDERLGPKGFSPFFNRKNRKSAGTNPHIDMEKSVHPLVSNPTYATADDLIAYHDKPYFLRVIDTDGNILFSRTMNLKNIATLWSPGSIQNDNLSFLGIHTHSGDGFVHNFYNGVTQELNFGRELYPLTWRPHVRQT